MKIRDDLMLRANYEKASLLQRFFKTEKGEYGEGDIFLGVMVPDTRLVAKKYRDSSLTDIKISLQSKFHEERLCALLILVEKSKNKPMEKVFTQIFNFYLKNIKFVNNWDLVDLSAPKIVGEYLVDKPRDILYKLVKSENLWARRVAIISTFAFIRRGDFSDTIRLSKILLTDKQDLLHKAVGWALREVGKKSLSIEEKFLKKYSQKMPRTMLRYAIEKFPKNKRFGYLKTSR